MKSGGRFLKQSSSRRNLEAAQASLGWHVPGNIVLIRCASCGDDVGKVWGAVKAVKLKAVEVNTGRFQGCAYLSDQLPNCLSTYP